jgi:type I restriction enzyme R subunit
VEYRNTKQKLRKKYDRIKQGYSYIQGAELAPDTDRPARASFGDVILEGRLREAVARINSAIPAEAQEQAIKVLGRVNP